MKELDGKIENDISGDIIHEYVEADIRNRLAHLELQTYNDKQEFKYKHPIVKNKKQMDELDRLRRYNPEEFSRKMIAAHKNIERYKSYLNNNRYKNDTERMQYEQLLQSHQNTYAIMQKVLAR